MKDKRRESFERLSHILKAINDIEIFTQNVSENEFLNDEILSSAVLFQFSVIGEAIIHVESSILDKFDYPWYKVRSFRNLISHEYFKIKLEAVWEIIIADLPEFKQVIEKMLVALK
ncbi:MAG: DUF86 domain-containing protein [Bacteroidales bacterium]|nr:DUF86 domain-containing protein [Bacteroidales bacterium]